jgi:hypothetical protein
MSKQGSANVRALGVATVDEEIRSVAAAIEMVAAGSASRVTLAGLRFGAALVPEARRRAASHHVRVRPLWPMGDGPVDLVIEASDEGESVEPDA